MGLIIKRNKDGLLSLKSSISDESYHPDKKWVTVREAKKIMIEKAFWEFVEKSIEYSMDFPNGYQVNGKFERGKAKKFHEWYMEVLKTDNDQLFISEFNKALKENEVRLTCAPNDITWRDVYDAMKVNPGDIFKARENALKAGYKYMNWNDQVYDLNSELVEPIFLTENLL